jgi:1,4-alpha-glucan branching enzyme
MCAWRSSAPLEEIVIRSQARRGTNQVKLTFVLPHETVDGPVAVVGDFNDWDPSATVLLKHGREWRSAVEVEGGRRYAFRYLAQGDRWFNDEVADDYQPNAFGGSDSVVDLTDRHRSDSRVARN